MRTNHDGPHALFVDDDGLDTIVMCPLCAHDFSVNDGNTDCTECPNCGAELFYAPWCEW